MAQKLKHDLGESAKTCTFHSYCKELLHKIKKDDLSENFILFPKLEYIIKSDAKILYEKQPNFLKSFRAIDLTNKNISFFLKRSSYYNAVAFDDSVYRVFEYLRYHPDEIPVFTQIVVDEYQDFNKLEVEFLNVLSEKNPILIVGDDDQALYGALKSASSKFIREKFNDPSYERFCLPFCSRCTLVITRAIDDIIAKAQQIGKLNARIDKQYFCYLPDKWRDNKKYPKITHAHCSVQSNQVPYIAKFIFSEIKKLSKDEIQAANEKSDYTVLIAGSGHYLKQVQNYFRKLDKYRLSLRKADEYFGKIRVIDGYKTLIREGYDTNLGWRILLEADRVKKLKSIIEKTNSNPSIKLKDILPASYTKKHITILKLLHQFLEGDQLSKSDEKRVASIVGLKLSEIKQYLESDESQKIEKAGAAKDEVSIVFSTYVGCKGLSAGYVFIIGLDEGSLPRNNSTPSDIEICDFIVALTRTIKKCYLVSTFIFSGKKQSSSIFIDWIKNKRLEYIKVDKNYF